MFWQNWYVMEFKKMNWTVLWIICDESFLSTMHHYFTVFTRVKWICSWNTFHIQYCLTVKRLNATLFYESKLASNSSDHWAWTAVLVYSMNFAQCLPDMYVSTYKMHTLRTWARSNDAIPHLEEFLTGHVTFS